MNHEATCPNCGQALQPGVPEGLCPKCLLKGGVAAAKTSHGHRTPYEEFRPGEDSLVGRTIASFTIERELGRGGMGVVYKAHEQSLHRAVALKVLAPHLAKDRTLIQRFHREARAVAQLNNPHIVTIYAVGEFEGIHYIAMEYIKGRPLSDVISATGQLEVRLALDIAQQITAACVEAHSHNIVHRDIKPQNVMVDRAGRVKVLDFGLAKLLHAPTMLTNEGTYLGTPAFMSPEQIQGHAVDVRTDIFSIGVTLYLMLAGRLPFQGDGSHSIMYQIVHGLPADIRESNADVPEDVARAVNTMLEKDPDRRHSSALVLMEELGRLINQAGGVTPHQKTQVELRSAAGWSLRRRLGIGAVACIGVLLLVAGYAFMGGLEHSKRNTDRAQNPSAATGPVSTGSTDSNTETNPDVSSPIPTAGFFTDRNLEAAVRSAIGKPVGELKLADLAGNGFTKLETRAAVGDLRGIEQCTNLVAIIIDSESPRGTIVDLSPLSNLKSLELLSLRYNNISDLRPLAGLPRLRSLNLMDNAIENVAPLRSCTKLTYLNLLLNPLKDLSPLSTLTGLEDLAIGEYNSLWLNQRGYPKGLASDFNSLTELVHLKQLSLCGMNISDIGFLSGLTELRSLSLGYGGSGSGNRVTDIGPLAHLEKLESLDIGHNPVTDIEPLRGLTQLQNLNLSSCKITDISPLSNLTRLKFLRIDAYKDVNGRMIAELRPLSTLTVLEELWFIYGPQVNIEPLGNLVNLRHLHMLSPEDVRDGGWGDSAADLSPLAKLTNLETLDLGNSRAKDWLPLSNLKLLRNLSLGNCQLKQVTFLKDMSALVQLSISNNKITSLAGMEHLANLELFDANHNDLDDISALASLPKLSRIVLDDNPLTDVSSLAANTSFGGAGREVSLKNTKLTPESATRDLGALTGRGVKVYYEPAGQ